MSICTHCKNEINSFICDRCSSLNDIDENSSYFHLFFNEERLSYSLNDLEKRYYQLQKRIHPDLFRNASNEQKSLSAHYSEKINDAFKILKDPIRKAKYYADFHGIYQLSDKIPIEVIDDIFDIQELLQSPELSENEIQELERYQKKFKEIQKNNIAEIDSLFKKLDQQESNEDDKNLLNIIINKSAYLKRILAQIEDKIDEL